MNRMKSWNEVKPYYEKKFNEWVEYMEKKHGKIKNKGKVNK